MNESVTSSFPRQDLENLLRIAFEEDLGSGDVTSLATISKDSQSKAFFIAKEDGVLCGLQVIETIQQFRSGPFHFHAEKNEGDALKKGDHIGFLEGSSREILECERILLNFMQHLSGIASVTAHFCHALQGSKTQVLDTRKTLPGYRNLDKYAVRCGGGSNHRQGLFDQVLIKDNHIRACGSVRAAVDMARKSYGNRYKIEAEVETIEEIHSLLDSPVDVLLLDNMNNDLLQESIRLVRDKAPQILLEASGNMDLQRVIAIKHFGLDFISVGSLTHSVKAMDISLRFES